MRSTVVRGQSKGYRVSAIPLTNYTTNHEINGTYEVLIFRFLGYSKRVGKQAMPDAGAEAEETRYLSGTGSFKDDPEGTSNYHDQVIEEIARMLEEE